MALSLGEKAQRVLKLLIGLRSNRVAAALAPYGFDEKVIEEGWSLLREIGRNRGAIVASTSPAGVISELDAWENQWFPIASTSLLRHYPAAHARAFLNLSQTEGPEVAVTVGLLLERIEQMSDPNGPYGEEGPKARKLLQTRGLTDATLAEARTLLNTLGKIEPPTSPKSREEEQAELARAEKALWDWYLEWSQIARITIKNRTLLRQLGFLKPTRSDGSEESEASEDPELDETESLATN